MPSGKREEQGRCISSLVLDAAPVPSGEHKDSAKSFMYRFRRASSYEETSSLSQASFHGKSFSCGDYVVRCLNFYSSYLILLFSVVSGHIPYQNLVFVPFSPLLGTVHGSLFTSIPKTCFLSLVLARMIWRACQLFSDTQYGKWASSSSRRHRDGCHWRLNSGRESQCCRKLFHFNVKHPSECVAKHC
jgi:hypothetical protein